METREEKFKKYREEISLQEKKIEEEPLLVDEEVLDQQEINHQKRNTLTMSIDQIIEAHDQYTMIIEQKELKEKIKKEKRLQRIAFWKKVGKISLIVAVILVVIFVIVILIEKVIL